MTDGGCRMAEQTSCSRSLRRVTDAPSFAIRHPSFRHLPSAIPTWRLRGPESSARDLVSPLRLPAWFREEGAGVPLPLQARGQELDQVAQLGLGEELDDVLGHRRVAALLLLDL